MSAALYQVLKCRCFTLVVRSMANHVLMVEFRPGLLIRRHTGNESFALPQGLIDACWFSDVSIAHNNGRPFLSSAPPSVHSGAGLEGCFPSPRPSGAFLRIISAGGADKSSRGNGSPTVNGMRCASSKLGSLCLVRVVTPSTTTVFYLPLFR